MAIEIGALRAMLSLDSAAFVRGVQSARRSLNAMRSQFLVVAGVAAAFGTAITGLAVRTSRTAGEIERFSQISNSLPGEFQRWAAGAATVGIEQERLADILKDVNDRVGDFLTTGGGPMADFFENIAPRIGITADAFRGLSGPQALQLYVDSLEQAGVSQQEMTFYLEAMASDTTALIPLLRSGGAAMAALGANAADLGGVMSDETVASLDSFRLALADAGTALQGIGYRISGTVAPALTALTVAFVDAMREGGALRAVLDALIENIDVMAASLAVAVAAFGIRYVGALALSTIATFSFAGALAVMRTALITTGIGALIVGAGYLVAKFLDLVAATGSFGAAMTLLGEVASGVWEGIKTSASAIPGALYGTWTQIKADFTEMISDMLFAWGGFMSQVAEGIGNIASTLSLLAPIPGMGMLSDLIGDGVTAGINNLATATMAASNDLLINANNMRSAAAASSTAASETVAEGFDRAREALAALNEIMQQGTNDTAEASDAARVLSEELQSIEEGGGAAAAGIDEVARATENAAQAQEQWASNMAGHFDGLITGGKNLSGVLQSMARQLESRGWQQLFMGIAGGGGGGGGGFFSNLIGNLFGGFRAEGGPVSPGRSYVVGERGPELFTPGASGQITSNENTRGGGQTVVRLELSSDLEARILGEALGQSVQVVRTETPKMIQGAFRRGREERAFT